MERKKKVLNINEKRVPHEGTFSLPDTEKGADDERARQKSQPQVLENTLAL
jgi:hypothetical protein